MTNEQIIKGLTKMLDDTIEANECGLSNNDFKDDIELLKSALSLIKEQQEKMDKKDKQIDLMADFMYKTGTGRRALSCMFRQNDECNENGCRYCIRQYFANQAKTDQ